MIGRLTGIIIEKSYDQVLLDVQGVGYEVDISLPTLESLADIGQSALLHIHSIIREDAHILYGFSNVQERAMFRLLVKVNGIGPKVALAILSGMEWHTLITNVQTRNVNGLVKIPGVGKKTAERLVIELQDKLPTANVKETLSALDKSTQPSIQSTEQEAQSALINLGYKPAVASQAIQTIMQQSDWQKTQQTSTDLIRLALRSML